MFPNSSANSGLPRVFDAFGIGTGISSWAFFRDFVGIRSLFFETEKWSSLSLISYFPLLSAWAIFFAYFVCLFFFMIIRPFRMRWSGASKSLGLNLRVARSENDLLYSLHNNMIQQVVFYESLIGAAFAIALIESYTWIVGTSDLAIYFFFIASCIFCAIYLDGFARAVTEEIDALAKAFLEENP